MNLFKKLTFALLFFSVSITSAYAQTFWGALYVDKQTGIAGGSYNMDDEDEAQEVALESCIEKHNGKPNNCKLVTTFYNGCISLYMGNNNKGGWGFDGYSTRDAIIRAIDSCNEHSGEQCKEVLTFCTSRYY